MQSGGVQLELRRLCPLLCRCLLHNSHELELLVRDTMGRECCGQFENSLLFFLIYVLYICIGRLPKIHFP